MWVCRLCVVLCAWLLSGSQVGATELTFELADNDKQCFYEEVEKNIKTTLEYQVVTGGHYDVDVTLEGPGSRILYKEKKKQYDTYTWTTDIKGVYKFCFSNEFSTFAHKTVYFDFYAGDEPPLTGNIGAQASALTQLEASCVMIHESLKTIINFQTRGRLREAHDRAHAEMVNNRVQWWSIAEFCAILFVGIGQVVVLRSFFTDKRPATVKT
ncbi:transmembrane emp24 domain-containing protein 3-like [Anneissia japonica]|uniref:transmembrane emp24 domain-containing protein 3-like n=1 Tax=Anneissia japonica TaxID=1529436 RepID=UPI001425A622|nr:transmembrane emp24 domain-containing protein 3-like [Anneissia japonica]